MPQGNMTMKDKSYDHEEKWMLHGSISRKGYGNALIGRYGGCFEEDIWRFMYDKAYHSKGLDAPAKFAPTPTRRAMHGTEEASKISEGGSANNRILALVPKELMHLLSVTLYL